jgi:hypothetical protein
MWETASLLLRDVHEEFQVVVKTICTSRCFYFVSVNEFIEVQGRVTIAMYL